MNHRRLWASACCVLAVTAVWLALAVPAHAAINKQIAFQGKLTNSDGTNVVNGNFGMRFRIYTDPTADAANTCSANSCKWEETQASVSVSSGIFQVDLGSVTALPASVDFNSSALYLGVKVGSDAEMTPRIHLTAAPYAFNSDLLDGMDSAAFLQLSPGAQQTGNLNISGTVTSGAVNGVTIGSTIQPGTAGALSVQSNGANPLNLDVGGASNINIGTGGVATTVTVGNISSNPNIVFNNGTGTFSTGTGNISLNGSVTVASGKTLTVTSNTINSNTFSSSTLTFGAAGTATVQSAASQALNLTGNAASTWSTSAGNITVQAGSGTVSLGSSTLLSSTGALSLNSGAAAALTVDSGTTGALNLGTGANAKTITLGNNTGATVIANLVGTSTTAFKVQGPSSAVYLNIDSSNNRLYVGNPTADATAFLLILDYKNSTGDPTAVNGAEYYNSANNKFRCAQNSIWSDCTTGFNSNTLSADQAATQSSTTMQNVTALGFSAAANTTYVFDAWIPVNDSNATADFKYTFTTPTSSTLNIMTLYYSSATANVICNIVTSGTACANTTINLANHFVQVRGQVAVAGTAGTVQFQFAQNTSTAASFPVIKKGATLSWKQSN